MAAPKNLNRVKKELKDLKEAISNGSGPVGVVEVKLEDDSNISVWQVLIAPPAPYNDGRFWVSVKLPSEFPFSPPELSFITPIYHLNVSEKGEICQGFIDDCWKPGVTVGTVLGSLLNMLIEPKVERPLRVDLAQLFEKNRKSYMKQAEKFTKAKAVKPA